MYFQSTWNSILGPLWCWIVRLNHEIISLFQLIILSFLLKFFSCHFSFNSLILLKEHFSREHVFKAVFVSIWWCLVTFFNKVNSFNTRLHNSVTCDNLFSTNYSILWVINWLNFAHCGLPFKSWGHLRREMSPALSWVQRMHHFFEWNMWLNVASTCCELCWSLAFPFLVLGSECGWTNTWFEAKRLLVSCSVKVWIHFIVKLYFY